MHAAKPEIESLLFHILHSYSLSDTPGSYVIDNTTQLNRWRLQIMQMFCSSWKTRIDCCVRAYKNDPSLRPNAYFQSIKIQEVYSPHAQAVLPLHLAVKCISKSIQTSFPFITQICVGFNPFVACQACILQSYYCFVCELIFYVHISEHCLLTQIINVESPSNLSHPFLSCSSSNPPINELTAAAVTGPFTPPSHFFMRGRSIQKHMKVLMFTLRGSVALLTCAPHS